MHRTYTARAYKGDLAIGGICASLAGMSDATSGDIPRAARQAAPSVPLPKPVAFGAPVLISDCITPLAGETVLSLLMKRMMQRDLGDQ